MTRKITFYTLYISLCLIFAGYNTLGQTPDFIWAKGFGSNNDDQAYGIAHDPWGNIYTIGTFKDTASFYPGAGNSITNNSMGDDIFILKQDGSGNLIWLKHFKGRGNKPDLPYGIVADTVGNVYATGYFMDTVDFDPGTGTNELIPNGSADIFITKLDSAGQFVWAKQIGGPGDDRGMGINLDKMGNVYTTGYFYGTVDFDPSQSGIANLSTTPSGRAWFYHTFISKLDSDGNFVWAKQFVSTRSPGMPLSPGGPYNQGEDIYIGVNGEILVTGTFRQTTDFNTGTDTFQLVANKSADNAYIVKLDTAGNYIWAKQLTGRGSAQNGNSAAKSGVTDWNGNVYITGTFVETIDFDPGTDSFLLTSVGSRDDAYILKLDSSGSFKWVSQVSGSGLFATDGGTQVIVDNITGSVYTAGYFTGTADLNPGTGTYKAVSKGGADVFLIKQDTASNFQWALNLGSPTTDAADAMTFYNGSLYVTGMYAGIVDFDTDTSASATYFLTTRGCCVSYRDSMGSRDVYTLKLSDCSDLEGGTIMLSGADSVCMGNTYTYSLSAIPGAVSYTWLLPEGWKGNSTTSSIEALVNGEGTVTVKANGYCDTLSFSLTVKPLLQEVAITVDSFTLSTAATTYTSWQWYKNNSPIPGATTASYTVSENGTYCVTVMKDDCSDTACYTVANVPGTYIHAPTDKQQVNVYPNPANHIVYITSSNPVRVVLCGLDGRLIAIKEEAETLSLENLAEGVYFLHIYDKTEQLLKVVKIIKQ